MHRSTLLPLIGAVLAATAGSASASLLAYEPFNYSTGSVVGQSGGTGFVGAWTYNPIFEGAGSTGGNVISGGLTYPGLPTSGGALTSVPNYEVADRTLFSTAPTSGIYQMSFLVSRLAGTPGYGGLSVFDSSGNSEELFLGFTGGSLGTDSPASTSGIPLADNPLASLMVFKFDFDLGSFSGYVNPVVGNSEPGSPAFTFTEAFSFSRLGINAEPGIIVDEIRLGQSFSDVTPVPEPATIGLLACGAGALGFLRRRPSN